MVLTPRALELRVGRVSLVLKLGAPHRLNAVSGPLGDSACKKCHTVFAGEQGDVIQVQKTSSRIGGVKERQGEQSAGDWC